MKKILNACIVLLLGLIYIVFTTKVNAQTNMGVSYEGHVQNIGWQNAIVNGDISGTTGQGLRLEALKITLQNPLPGVKVKYQLHVQNIGWQDWVSDGQVGGTTGQSLRVEAIRVVLEGAPAGYHVQYQAHVQNVGWQNWVSDGQIAGTTGQSLRMEALRIKIIQPSKTFAIDIGHNVQYDTGAVGIRKEDDLTKEVGTKVINKLTAMGYGVINCTPTTASNLVDSLSQRIDKANANNADLFVSIHFNSYNGSASGSEVYYYTTASNAIAQTIVNNIASLGYINRGAKYNDYYVLRNAKMNAVLVEAAFVDNINDMNRYNAEDIANAIVKSIVN